MRNNKSKLEEIGRRIISCNRNELIGNFRYLQSLIDNLGINLSLLYDYYDLTNLDIKVRSIKCNKSNEIKRIVYIIADALNKWFNLIKPDYIIYTKSRAITVIKDKRIIASIIVNDNNRDDDTLLSSCMDDIYKIILKKYIYSRTCNSKFICAVKHLIKQIITSIICDVNYSINCSNGYCNYKLYSNNSRSFCRGMTNLIMDKLKFLNWGIHLIHTINRQVNYKAIEIFNKYDLLRYLKSYNLIDDNKLSVSDIINIGNLSSKIVKIYRNLIEEYIFSSFPDNLLSDLFIDTYIYPSGFEFRFIYVKTSITIELLSQPSLTIEFRQPLIFC